MAKVDVAHGAGRHHWVAKPKGMVLPLPEVGGVGLYPGTLPKLPAAPGGLHTERRCEHGPDYTEKPGFRESVNGTWIHG